MDDSSIGLLRELFERRLSDAEASTFRLIEELRAAVNVLTERVAELTIAASPAASSDDGDDGGDGEHEPDAGSPAAVEDEQLADELTISAPAASSDDGGDAGDGEHEPDAGTPAAVEDEQLADELEAGGASDELVEEVIDIKDEIAQEYEEETRPERMFWLHRPVGNPFSRR